MKWFDGQISEAIAESRAKKAWFVVVVLHGPDKNDEKTNQMLKLWDIVDENSFQQPMIAIRIYDGTEPVQQFAQIYPVPIVPAAYIIDLNGKPLDVITVTDTMDDVVFMSRLRTAAKIDSDAVKKANDEGKSSSSAATAGDSSGSAVVEGRNPPTVMTSEQPSATDAAAAAALSVEEKAKRAKELLEKKRLAEEAKKREEERERELQRRNTGKLLSEVKATREELEAREIAQQRRRDKLDAQQQLKRLREQIKADREEQQRREFGNLAQSADDSSAKAKAAESKPFVQQPIPSSECRIQCRFPDGSNLIHQFPSSCEFQELIELIKKDGRQKGDFYLVQMYPRREFPDTSLSFLELGLTPSATMLVISKRSSLNAVVPSKGSGIVNLLLYAAVVPFQLVYNLVMSLFGYGGSTGSSSSQTSSSAFQRRTTTNTSAATREHGISRQEGNIRRFRNEDDAANPDPDDEARWNGNSTQQL